MATKYGYFRGIRSPHTCNEVKERMISLGCDNSKIIIEGAGDLQPELRKLVNSFKSGDTLIVLSLANLSPKLTSIVNLFKTLYTKNVRFISIEDNLDTADEISQRWERALGDHQYKTRRASYERQPVKTKKSRSDISNFLSAEARDSYVIELYQAQRPILEIMAYTDITKATVYRILKNNGIDTSRKAKSTVNVPRYGGDTES